MSQKDCVRTHSAQNYQTGVRRPALQVDDLPTPEEVFKVKRIRVGKIISSGPVAGSGINHYILLSRAYGQSNCKRKTEKITQEQ